MHDFSQTRQAYPIGVSGQPWGPNELAQWRSRQTRQRSYSDDVLAAVSGLQATARIDTYGELVYETDRWSLVFLQSPAWQPGLPCVLVTGGVHGYETSGVLGALEWVRQHGAKWTGRVNWLVAPCVSPWAYERIQRWNYDAIDPNRSFRPHSSAQESAALMQLIARLKAPWAAHIDLHETTDTDETEFRPAMAARDGKPFVPGHIPDGFYLVDDTHHPQPAFQQAILEAVSCITHIAPADADGNIIGSPAAAPGVIRYALRDWGLCAGVTGATFTTTTEVYPDSPRVTPQQCIDAQVAAVGAVMQFVTG